MSYKIEKVIHFHAKILNFLSADFADDQTLLLGNSNSYKSSIPKNYVFGNYPEFDMQCVANSQKENKLIP